MTSAAIAGLGMTDVGNVYGRTAADLAADAVRRAVADAGLSMAELDGLLVSSGMSRSDRVDLSLARDLGLTELRLLVEMNAFGASAGAMVSYATAAVAAGAASTVACVFADAPLKQGRSSGAADASNGRRPIAGFRGLRTSPGAASANAHYPLAARPPLPTYRTTTRPPRAVPRPPLET